MTLPETVTPVDERLAPYLERPLSGPDPRLLAMVDEGPCDPEKILHLTDLDRMVDPAPLEIETGWCRLDDGSGFVAARVPMPDVTADMVDWWFDWHPRSPERYVAWHPVAHIGASVEGPDEPGEKPFWNAVHQVAEDVGTGPMKLRIEFRAPTELGFSDDYLDDERVGTIVCGIGGDRLMRNTLMCHVWLREGDGLVLRSHFWIGAVVSPRLPASLGWLGRLADRPLNSGFVRNLAMPGGLPQALCRHCVEEYTNLAAILPPLHKAFGSKEGES